VVPLIATLKLAQTGRSPAQFDEVEANGVVAACRETRNCVGHRRCPAYRLIDTLRCRIGDGRGVDGRCAAERGTGVEVGVRNPGAGRAAAAVDLDRARRSTIDIAVDPEAAGSGGGVAEGRHIDLPLTTVGYVNLA